MWAGFTMAQPQPRVNVLDPDWALLEFDNGSHWYIKANSLVAIWAIPEEDAKQLGYNTRLYFTGGTINVPMPLVDVVKRMKLADDRANRLLFELIEQREKEIIEREQ